MEILDLRNTPCPINFVRTKLKLDEMPAGSKLQVLLGDGEPVESVTMSVQEEGHSIIDKIQSEDQSWILKIERKN
ncbi:MAG: sulfurtransferase TusA family protein [Candidatus Melainabacteria bacterium]|nr:sulfurtransferase TusA family protein [Candidatus Melainabacteria bacterium]